MRALKEDVTAHDSDERQRYSDEGLSVHG